MQLRASVAAVTVVGTLFMVGCNSSTLPIAPTSVPHVTASSISGTVAAMGASASTDVLSIPVGFTIQPGAKALIQLCVGEAITFVGDSRLVAHQTTLPDGSLLLDMIHFNGQGAVAVGESTGVTYRLVGADSNPIIFPPSGALTATFEAKLQAIGPGDAKSFMAHILQHITMTPAGSITALIDVVSIDCR